MERTYKLIQESGFWPNNEYAVNQASFGFISAPSTAGTVTQRSEICSCREVFGEQLQEQLDKHENLKIPVKHVRLLLYTRTAASGKDTTDAARRKFFENVKTSVNAVNILERKYKWRLTRVYPLVNEKCTKALMCMVVGPNNWIRSPHMQSMYCLILRAAKTEPFEGIKTYANLMAACKKHVSKGFNDSGYIRDTYEYWGPIMMNFKNLFLNLSMTVNYSRSTYGGERVYHEGIRCLVQGGTNNKELKARFKKYCKDGK